MELGFEVLENAVAIACFAGPAIRRSGGQAGSAANRFAFVRRYDRTPGSGMGPVAQLVFKTGAVV
jgi:hypothetical protein